MPDGLRGQVTEKVAEIYDEFIVPAIFQEWAPRMARAARLSLGDRVLDAGCGTGALAREAALWVGPMGSVVGLDCDPSMLGVARRAAPGIEWREGRVEALPFADGAFDAVVSQFGLTSSADRVGALREMWRVLCPGGRLAVAVWDRLETSPGYAALVALLQHLFGEHVAGELCGPYTMGDGMELLALAREAGIVDAEVRRIEGTARFASIASWMRADVQGRTLAGLIDDSQYRELLREAERELIHFVQTDGSVAFGTPAHVLVATRP